VLIPRYPPPVPLATRDPAAAVAEVVRLAGLREPRCGGTRIVAVDGPSGSGKSTLGTAVGDALAAPVVHMDDIYPGWDGLAEAVPLLTTQVLAPLADGRPAAYRRWSWVRHEWSPQAVPVPASPLLVLEGVGSSVRPAGDYASVCVWVEAGREVRFRRGIDRDGEAYRPHWERWARQEDALFAADRTRDRADVVLDTTTL
jgi:uridine kinase